MISNNHIENKNKRCVYKEEENILGLGKCKYKHKHSSLTQRKYICMAARWWKLNIYLIKTYDMIMREIEEGK